ncbi:MAG: NosD domain-containing protein [Candidatus Bathyarchaeales archaeon]
MQKEREAERKPRKWPKGKILVAICLLLLIFGSYAAWQYMNTPPSSEKTPPPSQETPPQTSPTAETIYIMTNGTIYPSTAPISNKRNSYYTFKSHVNMSIVVERDNIVIDGAGYTLQGLVNGTVGIDLTGRYNVTVKNVKIQNFEYGIYLYSASHNVISGNDLKNNYCGIWLDYSSNNTIISNSITDSEGNGIGLKYSSNNTISENKIMNNKSYGIYIGFSTNNTVISANQLKNNTLSIFIYSSYNNTVSTNYIENSTSSGISLSSSSKNIIYRNNLANNTVGISLSDSSDNMIYNNNFVGNAQQVQTDKSINLWNSASSGNHWSNYQGVDSDNNGIGDTPYIIDENNKDEYPLMKPIVA